ncbi:MAG: 2-oxoacid:acceptor oxidoreductase family protein [candidate division WOR-3 bacterium]
MDKMEIRFAGTGGQGIILLGVLAAEAATIAGNYATQGSYYGAQVRGGITSADVVLGKEWIPFPYVEKSDLLVTLTSESLDHYVNQAKPGSIIIVDENVIILEDQDELQKNFNLVRVPLTHKCFERFNSNFFLNIVTFGFVVRYLKDFFTEEHAIQALKNNVPERLFDEELAALRIGLNL